MFVYPLVIHHLHLDVLYMIRKARLLKDPLLIHNRYIRYVFYYQSFGHPMYQSQISDSMFCHHHHCISRYHCFSFGIRHLYLSYRQHKFCLYLLLPQKAFHSWYCYLPYNKHHLLLQSYDMLVLFHIPNQKM